MDQRGDVGAGRPGAQRHPQRAEHQRGAHVPGPRPADRAAAEGVKGEAREPPPLPAADLAESSEQINARLLAAATDLCADTAVVVVGRMTIALLGTRTTGNHARLDRGANQTEVGLGLTGHDPAGDLTHVGAVEVETNTPHQLGHVRLAEAGVGAAGARGGTVEALVNATQQHLAIYAERPWMALDYVPDCHIPSV